MARPPFSSQRSLISHGHQLLHPCLPDVSAADALWTLWDPLCGLFTCALYDTFSFL